MIYCTFINWTISYLKTCKTAQFWIELRWKSIVLGMTHWYYCQRFVKINDVIIMADVRVRLVISWAHNQLNSSYFFIATRKFTNVSMAILFCSSNRLLHKFESSVTPNQIIGPSLLWKIELFRTFSLLLPQLYCLLPFIQVRNSAMAKMILNFSSSSVSVIFTVITINNFSSARLFWHDTPCCIVALSQTWGVQLRKRRRSLCRCQQMWRRI